MLGTGTLLDPFQITNRAELESIPNNYSAHYKLMNDIDLAGTNWTPLPYSSTANFVGLLDGNFKRISNMKIVGALNDAYIGLFKRLGKGGSVKNLGLVNVDISSQGHYTGALSGNDYQGNFENCYVTGTVKVTGSYNYIGAFVGQGNESNYKNCYTTATVIGGKGGNYGGFVGYMQKGSFIRCLALGYYNGTANNWTSSGAFCANIQWGNATYQAYVEDAHYDSTINPKGNPVGGITAKTTAQLKVATPYNTNWSTSEWSFVAGQYPTLVVPVQFVTKTMTVTSHAEEFLSSQVLKKVATKIRVSTVEELDADLQRQIRGSRQTSTFMRDIVSGSSRAIQVVKVANEVVTSYILPITSDVETLVMKFKIGSATVTSHIEGIDSRTEREIRTLRQAISFIDVLFGKSLTPYIKPQIIEAILVHIENGTLSQYLMNPSTIAMLNDVTAQDDLQSSSSTNVLENQTLREVR